MARPSDAALTAERQSAPALHPAMPRGRTRAGANMTPMGARWPLAWLALVSTSCASAAAARRPNGLRASGAPPPPTTTRRRHVGVWTSAPQFTPTCVNGAFGGTEQWASRTACCGNTTFCDSAFLRPAVTSTPPYTNDPRRDHHHVVDGPLAGNGNVGVAVGAGNPLSPSDAPPPWVDFFLSANAFWAVQVGSNHSTGTPFRGRIALPGTMQLGVARLALPAGWVTAAFSAEQDVDSARVAVNVTSQDRVTLSVVLWVSPVAPVVWAELSATAPGSSSAGGDAGALPAAGVYVELNTTVLRHFYHREASYAVRFETPTTARCGADNGDDGDGDGGAAAVVTRSSEYAGSSPNASVVGAILHTVRGAPAACSSSPEGDSTGLRFTVPITSTGGGGGGRGAAAAPPVVVMTVVRTTRDPTCVPVPGASASMPPLCGLPESDPAAAAAAIAAAVLNVTVTDAAAEHARHWAAFWNASGVSLPGEPETEDFWYGSLYVLNSAVPHAGQEQTPPGLYGPWGTVDNPGWHGDFTIDYNYEATFYGVMGANHPELMTSYPNPMLDFMPSARAYAIDRSRQALNKTCPGLHYPDVLAPWGWPESADGVNADAGLMSNGPYANMPLVWAWEYGDRDNLTDVRERWWPLVKGQADFFACWLLLNATDGRYHDPFDCTNESPSLCQLRDTVLTMSLVRRSLQVAPGMAAALGLPTDPLWARVLASIAPEPTGWLYVPGAGSRAGNGTHNCSFCAPASGDKRRTPTFGECQSSSPRVSDQACVRALPGGGCPAGKGLCGQRAFGSAVRPDGTVGAPSRGNSQSIFPCFPGDSVGTNSTLAGVGAATVVTANSWTQGNSFTKIFSAAARVVGPGLLDAGDVFAQWKSTIAASHQPNFVPFNPFSGFETVGAVEYVSYALLQSDPGGFIGLFDALPASAGDASFARLRARGAFVVSSSRVGGVVGPTEVESRRGSACVVRRPPSWAAARVRVADAATGAAVPVSWEGQGAAFFSFATRAGGVYVMSG